MAEKYQVVKVTSHRSAKGGQDVFGKDGVGVVLNDDLDTVYVNGTGWYGDWPIAETNVPLLRDLERIRELEKANTVEPNDPRAGYENLVAVLQGMDPNIPAPDVNTRSYLVTKDGKYLRIPNRDEFTKSFVDLKAEGLVQP